VSLERYRRARARRAASPVVILDIAVPRDFDPRIHDGELTCLFNIDDLQLMREQTLRDRRKHIQAAEVIIKEEQRRFWHEWTRRRNGPLIARLTADFEAKRKAILEPLMSKLNGRLTEADRALIEGAFRLLQNQILHGPISALTEEVAQEGGSHSLREALRKLFRLGE
jgi:glutamyl-tRNA reductase